MKRYSSRFAAVAAISLFSLGASTLLTGCWEKDHDSDPKGSVCNTSVTVVDLSATTGGLGLQLANGTYVVPTGSAWTDFHAMAGQKLLIGYTSAKKGSCSSSGSRNIASGTAVTLGCISVDPAATTTNTAIPGGGN